MCVAVSPLQASVLAAAREFCTRVFPCLRRTQLKVWKQYRLPYEGPGQKYREYRAPYEYGYCRALKTLVAGYPRPFIYIRDKAPVTTGHRSLIIGIITHHFSDHSPKLQGFIGIVALRDSSGLYSDRIDTVPYILYTFDRVLRTIRSLSLRLAAKTSR
jgi:hypothetical protein